MIFPLQAVILTGLEGDGYLPPIEPASINIADYSPAWEPVKQSPTRSQAFLLTKSGYFTNQGGRGKRGRRVEVEKDNGPEDFNILRIAKTNQ